MHLVYEIILLNKMLRYHLLSENLQWNYASFNVNINRLTSIGSNKIIKLPKYFICGLSLNAIPLTESIPFLSHARSRSFAWDLLWLSTTEGKNIVKFLAVSQSHQFQLFLTNWPSNFWKIARVLGKIKNIVSLRSNKFILSEEKIVLWEDICLYWQ